MLRMGFSIVENMLKGLLEKERKFSSAVDDGLFAAGGKLVNYAIREEPTVPLDEGFLRGSYVIQTPGKRSAGINAQGSIEAQNMTVAVAFTAPYAHRLHEGIDYKFTEPGSGAKYLETKINRHKRDLIELAWKIIRKRLKI